MLKKPIDQLTIEEMLEEAGNPPITMNTYLYLAYDGKIKAMEKADRETYPNDQDQALGYVHRFMRVA